MAVNFALDCYIPKSTLDAFYQAVSDYQDKIGRKDGAMLKTSTIDFVKSVRKLTTIAKKHIPRKDIRKGKSDPKYLTATRDEVKGKIYRRMVVNRYRKGAKVNIIAWVPSQSRYVKRMGMRYGNYQGIVSKVDDTPKLVNLALKKKGTINRRGLAKKSWGWFMQSLFHQSAGSAGSGDENPKLKIERGKMVDGYHNETFYVGRKGKKYLAAESYTLVNKLKYIREAMPMGGFVDAMKAATKGLKYKMENALKSTRFGNS